MERRKKDTTWTLTEAHRYLGRIFDAAQDTPQVITERGKPRRIMVSEAVYDERYGGGSLKALQNRTHESAHP